MNAAVNANVVELQKGKAAGGAAPQTQQKGRRLEISLLSVLLCLLVIFIHVSSEPVTQLLKSSWQYGIVMILHRLSSFVVQGFILLSGVKLFLNLKEPFHAGKFYLSRFKKIVLPYVLWVAIYYLYFVFIGYFPFEILDLCRYIVVGDLVSHFYFIVAIVQFYLLAPLWLKFIKGSNPALGISFSLILTVILSQSLPDIINMLAPGFSFLYNDRIFTTYLVYWVAGCYIGLYYETFLTVLQKSWRAITLLFFISAAANAVFSYLMFTGKRHIGWLEHIHMLYCMSAILFFYLLAVKLKEVKVFQRPLLKRVDEASYLIYLSHCLVIFVVNGAMSYAGVTSILAKYLIRIVVTYTIAIGACLCFKRVLRMFRARRSN